MSSSRNGTPPTSSPNGLQNLLQNEMQDVDQQQALERQWLKVRMANHIRLMQDNQRVLDTSTAEDRALRQQRHRMREYQMDRMGVPGSTTLKFPEDEMGEIKIDSPVTTNHYHVPPTAPPPSPGVPGWMTAALVGTTLLAAALGGSYLNSLLNKPVPAPAPVNTKVESHEGFLLELVPDKGKAP